MAENKGSRPVLIAIKWEGLRLRPHHHLLAQNQRKGRSRSFDFAQGDNENRRNYGTQRRGKSRSLTPSAKSAAGFGMTAKGKGITERRRESGGSLPGVQALSIFEVTKP